MRWRGLALWGRRSESPASDDASRGEVIGRRSSAPRTARREWSRIDPLHTTAAAQPLVSGAGAALAVSARRRLAAWSDRARVTGAVPAGRVSNLVRYRAPHLEPAPHGGRGERQGRRAADPRPEGVELTLPAPTRRQGTVLRGRADAPVATASDGRPPASLDRATDDRVGAPQVADPPYRASAFEREITMVATPPPWMAQFDVTPIEEAAPPRRSAEGWSGAVATMRAGQPLRLPPPATAPTPPPAAATTPHPPVQESAAGGLQTFPPLPREAPSGPVTPAPTGPSMRRPPLVHEVGRPSRASLAQSRRLGLGRPVPEGSAGATREPAEPAPPAEGDQRQSVRAEAAPPPPSRVRATARLGLGAPLPLGPRPVEPVVPPHLPTPPPWEPVVAPAEVPVPPDPARRLRHVPAGPVAEVLPQIDDRAAPVEAPSADSAPSPSVDDEPAVVAESPLEAPPPARPAGDMPVQAAVAVPPPTPAPFAAQHRSSPASPSRSVPATSATERPVRRLPVRAGDPERSQRAATAISPGSRHAVPTRVASVFAALRGVDVSGVPVRRGRQIDALGSGLGAQAFSRGGTIYLPDAAGPLDHSNAQSLLAHELTHVLQQHELGGAPAETSTAGRDLEAEARRTAAVFHAVTASAPVAAATLRHLPLAALTARSPGERAAERETHGVQRATLGHAAGHEVASPDPADATLLHSWTADAPPSLDGSAPPAIASWSRPELMPARDTATPPGDPEPHLHMLVDRVERLVELCDGRTVDLDDPLDLDELAATLFGRLRTLLRGDLLIDRERAGLLADVG